MAERLGTMLAHLRRVGKDDIRWAQMARKCSAVEMVDVQVLRQMLLAIDSERDPHEILSDEPATVHHTPPKTEPQQGLDKEDEWKLQTPLAKKKRKMNKDDWESFVAAGEGLVHLEAIQSAEKALPPTKTQQKPAPPVSPKPGPQDPDLTKVARVRHSQFWGMLWVTIAKDQSYVQVMDPQRNKKVLLVGCSKSQCEHHQLLIHELADWIVSKGTNPLPKETVVAKRNSWLQQMKA